MGNCNPSSPKFCVYNIPICGGFCAPTINPDTSCFRHVSNEYTIPASGRYMALSPIIEFSPCCICCGKCGTTFGVQNRKPLMCFAAFVNAVMLGLGLVSMISGLSTDPGVLASVPYVEGDGELCHTSGCVPLKVSISIKSRYDRIDCAKASANSTGWTFDSQTPVAALGLSCGEIAIAAGFSASESADASHSRVILWDNDNACGPQIASMKEECERCKDNRLASFSLIVGVITQLPTIMTDLQRATPFGDVNCQNTMGKATNIFSFVSGLYSLIIFRIACHMNLSEGNGNIKLKWGLGHGFRCLMLATVLKVVDIVCHCLVPTPESRWNKENNKFQDVTDYLKLAGAPVAVTGGSPTTIGDTSTASTTV